MATLHSSSPGPAVRPNFPPGNFTLFQRIFGVISVNTHGELLKLMQMELKSVKNTTQMTLQSFMQLRLKHSATFSKRPLNFTSGFRPLVKRPQRISNEKMFFFQKWNDGFIQLGKMASIDKISASNSKFENLRWTPQQRVAILFQYQYQ